MRSAHPDQVIAAVVARPENRIDAVRAEQFKRLLNDGAWQIGCVTVNDRDRRISLIQFICKYIVQPLAQIFPSLGE